jgi:MFS family permease
VSHPIPATPPEYADPRARRAAVRWTLLLTGTFTVMAGAILTPSLPAMQEHFAAQDGAENTALWVKLVLTMPALFIVLGGPVVGWLVDRVGRKPLLLAAAVLYGAAGSSGFYLPSLTGILVGRALLGLAVAGLMTSVSTLIADYYYGPARARVMGQQAAVMGLGGTTYLVAGGFLATVSWRAPFLVYLASFLALPVIAWLLFEIPRRQSPPAPQRGEQAAGPEPGPWRTLGRLLALVYGVTFLMQTVFYMIPVQLPFYLKTALGAGAKWAGIAVAATTLCFALGSLASERISRRLGQGSTLALSFALVAAGYVSLGSAGSYATVLGSLVPAGVGFGILIPNMNVHLAAGAPEAVRGRAMGGLTTAVFLGQFLSPILTQPLIASLGLAASYRAVGIGLGVLAAVVLALVAAGFPRRS